MILKKGKNFTEIKNKLSYYLLEMFKRDFWVQKFSSLKSGLKSKTFLFSFVLCVLSFILGYFLGSSQFFLTEKNNDLKYIENQGFKQKSIMSGKGVVQNTGDSSVFYGTGGFSPLSE